MSDVLVEVDDLHVWFPVRGGGLRRRHEGDVRAVDGITFDIRRGETLGLVGESGSGKSTTGLALLRLLEATRGSVRFDGTDLGSLDRRGLRAFRRRTAMVFQDPYASLDPRMSIGTIVAEPLEIHGLHGGRRSRQARVGELLDLVGLAAEFRNRYPHELSGGQRQRVGIARALAAEPEFLVCDEPIAALDVSIQAQVLNLLADLQDQLGLTYLFIAHDLSAVQHLADRIAVLYLGRVVEIADRDELAADPGHPYTRSLLSAVPIPNPRQERERQRDRIILQGELPSPIDPPSGCNFRTRCPDVFAACPRVDPTLQTVGSAPGHLAACHLHGVVGREVEPDSEAVADPSP